MIAKCKFEEQILFLMSLDQKLEQIQEAKTSSSYRYWKTVSSMQRHSRWTLGIDDNLSLLSSFKMD